MCSQISVNVINNITRLPHQETLTMSLVESNIQNKLMAPHESKQNSSYSIFHGSTPALHGRQTEAKPVVLPIFRGLLCFRRAEVYPHLKLQSQPKKKKSLFNHITRILRIKSNHRVTLTPVNETHASISNNSFQHTQKRVKSNNIC